MERRTIYYANITVKHKSKEVLLKKLVYKARPDGKYHNLRRLKQHGIKEAVPVVKVEVIKSLGKETEQAFLSELGPKS
jgi:hypothetical protein